MRNLELRTLDFNIAVRNIMNYYPVSSHQNPKKYVNFHPDTM